VIPLLASIDPGEQATLASAIGTATSILAAVLFVLALKWLSSPATARRGNLAGEIGMTAAILGALLSYHIVTYEWIIVGFAIGAILGVPMAVFMPMTAVPQRTALSHAFGALAAALVGTAHYFLFDLRNHPPTSVIMFFLCLEVLLGALTFTGSLMAFGKLQDLLPTRPLTYKNQNVYNFALLGAAGLLGEWFFFGRFRLARFAARPGVVRKEPVPAEVSR
jgi:NAD(P) transhydrogenase subunit beta